MIRLGFKQIKMIGLNSYARTAVVLVTFLLVAITSSARGAEESSQSSIHDMSRMHRKKFVVFDTSSESFINDENELDDESLVMNADYVYDFGRAIKRKRLRSKVEPLDNNSVKSSAEQDKQITPKRARKNHIRKKSNLDVDVEYLESFLLSKQKKRERHHNKHKSDVKKLIQEAALQHVVNEEMKRFLESSADQSYVFTSIPSPSPVTTHSGKSCVEINPVQIICLFSDLPTTQHQHQVHKGKLHHPLKHQHK